MAVKKSASSTSPKKAAAKDAPAPKTKAVEVKSASAAKKETAPKKTSAATKSAAAAPKSAAPKAAAAATAPKKAATPKKAAAPAKLTSTQTDLLSRVHGAGEPGYRSEKKGEQRTLDALRERKLIKRGAKHKESGEYHYLISNAGKKHIETNPPAPAAPAGGSTPAASATNPPAAGGGSA